MSKIICFTKKIPKNKKGVMIAFLGQDGAGKSTVTKDIYDWLNWKIDVKKIYLGSGELYHSWEKKLSLAIRKKKGPVFDGLAAGLSLLDYLSLARRNKNAIKFAKEYTEKGGVIIFDRYPQVQFSGINDGPKIRTVFVDRVNNKILKRIFSIFADIEERIIKSTLVTQPDIVIKLVLPVEVSALRKPDENIEMIKMKHQIIKELQFCKSAVYEIDATQSYEQEILTIKKIIWDAIN